MNQQQVRARVLSQPLRSSTVMVLWGVSRAALVVMVIGPDRGAASDITYWEWGVENAFADAPLGTLYEYPAAALLTLALPRVLALIVGGFADYFFWVVAGALLLDAGYQAVLHRSRVPSATLFWLCAVPVLGVTALVRYDLLPGVLAGVALLIARRWPAAAGGVITTAAAVKLWPVILVPALVGRARDRISLLSTCAVIGSISIALTALLGGWSRVVSPLAYQSERGVQVEAVVATPGVIAAVIDPRWSIVLSEESRSLELEGPGVAAAEQLSDAGGLLLLCALAGMAIFIWRKRMLLTGPSSVWIALSGTTAWIVVGKVLSPQYLLWLLPLAAVGLILDRSPAMKRWALVLIIVSSLTQMVFPLHYDGLLQEEPSIQVTIILATRNIGLAVLMVAAFQRTFCCLRAQLPSESKSIREVAISRSH